MGWVVVAAADRAAVTLRRVGVSSVMRVNAHDSSFCGRSLGGDFASAEARRGLSDRPRRPFGPLLIDWYRGEALDGRGGSVSRRDLNQLARKHAQLAWGLNSKGKDKSIPSYSSGGGPGEALLLEKRPPPEFLPVIMKGDFL